MATLDLAKTGVDGLDHVLRGGLPRNGLYLVHGEPGVGKTTLALQFLLEGQRCGETGLYVTLSETHDEIRAVAGSHGWSTENFHVFDLSALEQLISADAENTLFHPAEVELHEITQTILQEVERVAPTRVVLDSLSELRLLAQTSLRYRRQVLSLKQYFAGRRCTVLLLDDRTAGPGDLQLESIAHGVINMHQVAPAYGADRRRLRVGKLRGVPVRSGFHEFVIRTGGIVVSPRLVAAEHHISFERDSVRSGVDGLDTLLGGGLDRGTSTLLIGPAGAGKSAITTQFAIAACDRGERASVFLFDEGRHTYLTRAHSLGMKVEPHLESGALTIRQIDSAEMGPGEFSALVKDLIDEDPRRILVIDSLNGYLHSMPDVQSLSLQLHEMLAFLAQTGVTTLITMAQHGMIGTNMQSPVDVTYVADAVVMLRFFEARGAILKSVAVVKKRSGTHENTIREFSLSAQGIQVGRPLDDFTGVLTGVPTYLGKTAALLEEKK
jgi:circadian clock protein KaiC